MRLSLQLMVTLAGPAIAGCGGGAAPPTMVAPGVTSVAFIDSKTLQPLVDGTSLPVIHGPQGGYHILVSLLAHGIWPGTLGVPGSPDDPTAALTAFRASGAELTLKVDSVDTLKIAWQPMGDGVAILDKQLRLDIHGAADIRGEGLALVV